MIYISSHKGLGDQIYMRPFVRALAKTQEVYLTTAWPDLYDEDSVKLVAYEGQLRTQSENVRAQADRFVPAPNHRAFAPSYSTALVNKRAGGLIQALEKDFLVPFLPDLFRWQPPTSGRVDQICEGSKILLYRLPTVRKEWPAPARNPDPAVMHWFLDRAWKEGYKIISVAHLAPGEEEPAGPMVYDLAFHYGQLSYSEIAYLMQRADLVLSPVGFPLPMGLAVGANLLVPFGGTVPSSWLTDPRMDLSRYTPVEPDPFCFCVKKNHDCHKQIPRSKLEEAWQKATACIGTTV